MRSIGALGAVFTLSAVALLAPRFFVHAMTYADLENLIEHRDLRSIEEVIPELPLDLRANFTLMHKSRSLQSGSRLHPRAVLFGDTAELVLTFNGHPDQAGYENLEVLAFDRESRRFSLHEITFALDQTDR